MNKTTGTRSPFVAGALPNLPLQTLVPVARAGSTRSACATVAAKLLAVCCHAVPDTSPTGVCARLETGDDDAIAHADSANARIFEEDFKGAPKDVEGQAMLRPGTNISQNAGADYPNRTDDLPLTRRMLYQLS